MGYTIIGVYKGEKEEIDRADHKRDAEYLVREYQLAFGRDWIIYFKKDRGVK